MMDLKKGRRAEEIEELIIEEKCSRGHGASEREVLEKASERRALEEGFPGKSSASAKRQTANHQQILRRVSSGDPVYPIFRETIPTPLSLEIFLSYVLGQSINNRR